MQRPAECAACRMRALDLTSGRDKFSSPSQPLAATVPFGKQGTVTFDASQHWQRPGLTLFNGTVYAAFASHCDAAEFHPWIFALDARSLQVYPLHPLSTMKAHANNCLDNQDLAACWFASSRCYS